MELLLLSTELGVETFNLPVIIGMAAAPLLLIGGAVWLALKMIKAKQTSDFSSQEKRHSG